MPTHTMGDIKCHQLACTFFMILVIICSTSPSCQGQEQPHVVRCHKPPPTPPPEGPPKPPPEGPPTPPPEGPPKPPPEGPPTPPPEGPPKPPTHSFLQAQVVRCHKPPPTPPPEGPPKPPPEGPPTPPPEGPPKPPPEGPPTPPPEGPPKPPTHSFLQAKLKSKTCYPNSNIFSPTGCKQMCKENGFKAKHSYYIKKQDSMWECCCPH